MYQLQNNTAITPPENTGNISGFPNYLNSLDITTRQSMGWFSTYVIDPNITEGYVNQELDTIFIPTPVVIEPVHEVKPISKLKLLEALERRGLATTFLSFIKSDDLTYEKWLASQELSLTHPVVSVMLPALTTQLNFTKEQVDALIQESEID